MAPRSPLARSRPHARLIAALLAVVAGLGAGSAAIAQSRPAQGQETAASPSPLFTTLATTDVTRPFRALSAINNRDLECLSQAVYFEARGEPLAGQAAVAQVVMNRVRHPAFPKSVCGVVYQRAGRSCQFSWACRGPGAPGSTDQWLQAKAIASRVLAGEVLAGIGFATHFNGRRAGGFGSGLQRVAAIGGHAFYRFNGPKGAPSMFQGPPAAVAQPRPAPAQARPVYASFAVLPSPEAAGLFLAKAHALVQQATVSAQTAAATLVERWTPEVASRSAPVLAAGEASPSAAGDHGSPNDRVGDSKPHPVG